MIQFIKDVRRDLETPDLPFVIAETGMSGLEEKHPRALSLMAAQKAVADYPDFKVSCLFPLETFTVSRSLTFKAGIPSLNVLLRRRLIQEILNCSIRPGFVSVWQQQLFPELKKTLLCKDFEQNHSFLMTIRFVHTS